MWTHGQEVSLMLAAAFSLWYKRIYRKCTGTPLGWHIA